VLSANAAPVTYDGSPETTQSYPGRLSKPSKMETRTPCKAATSVGISIACQPLSPGTCMAWIALANELHSPTLPAIISTVNTLIESNGYVTLGRYITKKLYANDHTIRDPVGKHISTSRYSGWKTVAVETIDGINTALWDHTPTGCTTGTPTHHGTGSQVLGKTLTAHPCTTLLKNNLKSTSIKIGLLVDQNLK